VVTGLIAVRVVADEPTDILNACELLRINLGIKQGIELGNKAFIATHGMNEAGCILGYVPGVLPCVALGVVPVVTRLGRVEWLAELAIALASADEPGPGVKDIAPVFGARIELPGDIEPAH